MEQVKNYGDTRQAGLCAYCANPAPSTRDHVPSRVFLDDPVPDNLPVVPACRECNEGFSLDEEYVAVWLEWAATGRASPEAVERRRISRVLAHSPHLAARLTTVTGNLPPSAFVEADRLQRVILKLARGHALFELNDPQFDKPTHLAFRPLADLAPSTRQAFETPPESDIWPEVGSRAMMRAVDTVRGNTMWLTVQPQRYRYLATVTREAVVIRLVLREYLAVEVVWEW